MAAVARQRWPSWRPARPSGRPGEPQNCAAIGRRGGAPGGRASGLAAGHSCAVEGKKSGGQRKTFVHLSKKNSGFVPFIS